MTTANKTAANTFATLAGIVAVTAKGAVTKNDVACGRVFVNPDDAAEWGYVTATGTESPTWLDAIADDDGAVTMTARERAVRALASRMGNEPRTGGRGSVGRGNPSLRHVAALAAVSRKNGATRPQVMAAITKATGVPMGGHLFNGLIAALRRNHDLTIDLDRETGRYTVAS